MALARQRSYLRRSSLVIIAALCLALLALAPSAAAAGPTLVQIINSGAGSSWGPTYSPDPSGIAYWPARGHLMIVDGEVDEMAIFAGANVFRSTLTGNLMDTYNLTNLSGGNEPVGIDIDVAPNGHFFISNDSAKKIFDFDIGPDGQFRTADDVVRTFLTSSFGNNDPEGLTLGPGGKLFTVDGGGREVYVTDPGSGGIFGDSNDTTTHFDVAVLGIGDPEGIDYNTASNTLYIADRKFDRVWELTVGGALVRSINIRDLVPSVLNIGDLTFAPASTGSGQNLYIVDRGVDNNDDPDENDGKIFEITVGQDTVAPSITDRSPASNQTDVSISANVTVIFSEPVTGVSNTSFTLRPNVAGSSPVAAAVTYDSATRTATLNPNANLAANTTYIVELNKNSSAIRDLSGNPLPLTDWLFTTGSTAPPTGNLIGNPGFETDANSDGRPDIWSSNARFTRSNQVIRSGSFAGRFFATDNSDVTINQKVTNLTASIYQFTGWVNIPATSDSFSFKLRIRWRDAGNNALRTDTITTYTAATSGWNQATASLTAPANTTNAQVLLVVTSLNLTIYVDDFELSQ